MKTKYFFLLGILSLFLLNSCSKDEELEQLDENSEVTTRAFSGSLNMSLTGKTITISWDKPFGEGVGIIVTVFDNTGTTYGGFSSTKDSGVSLFNLNLPDFYPASSLVALVKDLPASGVSTKSEYARVSGGNSGSGTDPGLQLCNHDYSVGNNITVTFDDIFSKCTINHSLFNPGKLMMLLSVGTRTFVEEWDGADFDGEKQVYSIYIPDGTHNQTIANAITTINVSQFQRFLSSSFTTMRCEVRFYHSSCPKVQSYYGTGFPSCTHYYKFEIPTQTFGAYKTFTGTFTKVQKMSFDY